ncbi:unnamed protein product [Rhizopus stolonifer]
MIVFTNNNRDHFPLKRLEVVTARLVDSKRTRKQVQLFCSAESLTKLKREKGTIGTVKESKKLLKRMNKKEPTVSKRDLRPVCPFFWLILKLFCV